MSNISPSQALTQLKVFITRVERLKANEYRPDSLGRDTHRKRDLNRLRDELRSIGQKVAQVLPHKHPEKVQPVLDVLKQYTLKGMDIAIEDVRQQMQKYQERPDATVDVLEQYETAFVRMVELRARTVEMPGFEDALNTRP